METPKIFIIHGRNLIAKRRIVKILQGFTVEAVVLSGEPVVGNTIIDDIERASEVDFVIALFTGDDQGREALTDKGVLIPPRTRPKLRFRARQNVVYEAGMLRSKLGKDRLLLLHEDNVELPSDLSGVRYVNLKENNRQISDRLKQIFDELGIPARLKRT